MVKNESQENQYSITMLSTNEPQIDEDDKDNIDEFPEQTIIKNKRRQFMLKNVIVIAVVFLIIAILIILFASLTPAFMG